MMSAKNASKDATAKPCLDIPLTVPVPASVIDDAIYTLKNVEYLLRDELDVRIGSISDNGRLDGGHHNFTDIAEVAAASKRLRDLQNELAAIKHAAQAETGARRTIADLFTPFFVEGLESVATEVEKKLLEAAARLAAHRAVFFGRVRVAKIFRARAAALEGNRGELMEPAPGTNPEAEAWAKLAKRDAARKRGSHK